MKIGPGETAPKHEHKLNRVVVYLSDQDFRVTNADGKVETPTMRQVMSASADRHTHGNQCRQETV